MVPFRPLSTAVLHGFHDAFTNKRNWAIKNFKKTHRKLVKSWTVVLWLVVVARAVADSVDEEGANLPQGEFDPDQRLLAGGHSEDFLSIMHDPSLMLLMLLLRAPETLNEGGVDLEDYEGLWELAERLGEVRRRGITEDEINRLPTHKYKPESGEKAEVGASAAEMGTVPCQICLVDFEVGDSLRGIPCKHDFHKDCIDEWLKRNATCPICRQEIKPS